MSVKTAESSSSIIFSATLTDPHSKSNNIDRQLETNPQPVIDTNVAVDTRSKNRFLNLCTVELLEDCLEERSGIDRRVSQYNEFKYAGNDRRVFDRRLCDREKNNKQTVTDK